MLFWLLCRVCCLSCVLPSSRGVVLSDLASRCLCRVLRVALRCVFVLRCFACRPSMSTSMLRAVEVSFHILGDTPLSHSAPVVYACSGTEEHQLLLMPVAIKEHAFFDCMGEKVIAFARCVPLSLSCLGTDRVYIVSSRFSCLLLSCS
jgi:hypothetical protein